MKVLIDIPESMFQLVGGMTSLATDNEREVAKVEKAIEKLRSITEPYEWKPQGEYKKVTLAIAASILAEMIEG